jgi:hypothetical protein
LKPFLGLTFGGSTTFLDVEQVAGERHGIYGGNILVLGEVLGVEADFAHAPSFFGDEDIGRSSSVMTVMGSVVAALPRSIFEYTLRPYVVAGAGLMRVRIEEAEIASVLSVSDSQTAIAVGGGATGFFSDRFGLNWDVRRFWRVAGDGAPEIDPEAAELSFWRATMAVVFRY